MSTYFAKPGEVEKAWYIVDAEGKVLGRLATRVAEVLRGKHKPEFTPQTDVGDFVIVINAAKVDLTRKKMDNKIYRHHSFYPGGLHTVPVRKMLSHRPEEVIRKAVRGMLPKNRLNRHVLTKLKVYAGPEHPHQAQRPRPLEI